MEKIKYLWSETTETVPFYCNVRRSLQVRKTHVKKLKVGRNHLTGFAIISVSSTGHNLTPRILTKFVVHTLAARCNAVPLVYANKCFSLAVNCFNQVWKSLFMQQLETWSQLEPGKLFCVSPKKNNNNAKAPQRLWSRAVLVKIQNWKMDVLRDSEKKSEVAALTWL